MFALLPVVAVGDALGLADEDTQLVDAVRDRCWSGSVAVVADRRCSAASSSGDRTGLIAAGIAAVYPYLWVNDGLIM